MQKSQKAEEAWKRYIL